MDKSNFVQERNSAVIKAVMDDDWTGVAYYCKKYNMYTPRDWKLYREQIYKIAQMITALPQEVKEVAAEKLRALEND